MKILFIGLDYHTYTRAIIDEMKALGAEVTYVDIQPRTLPFKVLRTASQSLYAYWLRQHHASAIEAARSVLYDKVIFLQVHQMAFDTLDTLRDSQPQAEFVLYNWDAISNHDYCEHAPFFDRVLTFDRLDAQTHGYGYLPLFCMRSMQRHARYSATPKSLYMVGNIVKPQRYHALEAFRHYCKLNGLIFRQHLKISPVVLVQLMRAGVHPRGLTLRSIDSSKFHTLIESSVGVFDFANHAQSGQTMRMMENLCAGKKIVTNNMWVKKEPFYSPDRIHVFNEMDFSGVAEFLRTPLTNPDKDFPEYHIQRFSRQLLGFDPLFSESRKQ